MKTLTAGDRVYYIQSGMRLHGEVQDFLPIKSRGESQMIPVRRRKTVVWKQRSELRKLPRKKV